MLDRLKTYWKDRQGSGRALFEARIDAFADPLARQVDWVPLRRVVCLYRERSIHRKADGSLVFSPTLGAMALPLGLVAMGFALMIVFAEVSLPLATVLTHPHIYLASFLRAVSAMSGDLSRQADGLIGIAMGALFLGLGLVLLHHALRPIRFDWNAQTFRKGFPCLGRREVPFARIHAVQLLTDQTSEDGSVAELNLVLDNASRVHVT